MLQLKEKTCPSFKIASAPGLHTRFSRPWLCPLFPFKPFLCCCFNHISITKFTILTFSKCTIDIKNIHIFVQPAPPSISKTFSSFQIITQSPLSIPPPPPAPALTTTILLSVSMNLANWVPRINGIVQYWYLILRESYNIGPFVTGLFH